ncbi:unnamed protein product [Blepharisma stoltei]|uniref:START domain-containing protein n=1 Tax=Blepharisma stoltei TaxID=1481888 RepID=A0AAU9JSU3_9CILI|nr:unnamed protein product [Blepharisma stoltei]
MERLATVEYISPIKPEDTPIEDPVITGCQSSDEVSNDINPEIDNFLENKLAEGNENTIKIDDQSVLLDSLHNETVSKIMNLYYDDKIYDALLELNHFKSSCGGNINHYPDLLEIEKDYQEIQAIYDQFEDKEAWTPVPSKDPIKLSFKAVPGTPTISILSETEFEVPVFNILTLIYEHDLYPLWIPFCKKSSLIKQLSRARKILAQDFNVSKIARRETCLYGFGADLLQTHGAIMIICRSCDNEDTFKGVALPPRGKAIRAKVTFLGCMIKPIDRCRTYVKFISNFDPSIKFLPYSILNYFTKKLAKIGFRLIIKHAKNFEGSEWQKRLDAPENRELYGHIERVLENYYISKGL